MSYLSRVTLAVLCLVYYVAAKPTDSDLVKSAHDNPEYDDAVLGRAQEDENKKDYNNDDNPTPKIGTRSINIHYHDSHYGADSNDDQLYDNKNHHHRYHLENKANSDIHIHPQHSKYSYYDADNDENDEITYIIPYSRSRNNYKVSKSNQYSLDGKYRRNADANHKSHYSHGSYGNSKNHEIYWDDDENDDTNAFIIYPLFTSRSNHAKYSNSLYDGKYETFRKGKYNNLKFNKQANYDDDEDERKKEPPFINVPTVYYPTFDDNDKSAIFRREVYIDDENRSAPFRSIRQKRNKKAVYDDDEDRSAPFRSIHQQRNKKAVYDDDEDRSAPFRSIHQQRNKKAVYDDDDDRSAPFRSIHQQRNKKADYDDDDDKNAQLRLDVNDDDENRSAPFRRAHHKRNKQNIYDDHEDITGPVKRFPCYPICHAL